jgi:hypothetical protein
MDGWLGWWWTGWEWAAQCARSHRLRSASRRDYAWFHRVAVMPERHDDPRRSLGHVVIQGSLVLE